MKSFVVTLTIVSFSLTAYAQQDIDVSEVPVAVQDAFKAEFADATDVEWEMKDDQYEAEYEMQDDTDYHVLFDASGTMIGRKHEIEGTALPSEVTAAIKKDYPDYEIDDAEMLVKDGETYYQVELEKFLRDKEKIYSASGEQRDDVSYWN